MNLENCNTVKMCLLWAEERFPGFWDFANCKPLSDEEIDTLAHTLENNEDYEKWIKHMEKITKLDRSEEALRLLKNGARAFKHLGRE